MLEQIGVKQSQLFCSSITGYGIPQGAGDLYDYICNEMSNDNLFVIMVLSQNYYDSPVCLNEMGAAWVKQSAYQSILLPGFQYSEIKGAVNPRDMRFSLSDRENRNLALNELKDRIIAHLSLAEVNHNLWERFRDKFIEEVEQTVQNSNTEETPVFTVSTVSFPSVSTDDERIILYYVISKKVRKLRKTDINEWFKTNEIYDVNIDNAFDLLSTLGNCKVEEDVLELDIDIFRGLISSSKGICEELYSCVLSHRHLSSDQFIKMWNNGDFDELSKLFVAYIIEERVTALGDRWMAEQQVNHIKEWEGKNSLDNSLSDNYGICLGQFVQNHFVYESNWTSYGNPKEYKLCPSLETLLLTHKFAYADEILEVKDNYKFELPF